MVADNTIQHEGSHLLVNDINAINIRDVKAHVESGWKVCDIEGSFVTAGYSYLTKSVNLFEEEVYNLHTLYKYYRVEASNGLSWK